MRTWADDVEDQRRDRDREQRRLIECQHGALRRQCELCKRDARIAELEAALRGLWDVATTVSVDGRVGCFVAEDDWRRLVVGPSHSR